MKSESRKKPGPEALYTTRIQLPIAPDMLKRIEKLDVNRSAFIRQAVESELKRRERTSPKPKP